MKEKIINDIRKELKVNIDKKTQENSQRFFKEDIKSYGVRIPVVNQISKTYFKKIQSRSKSEIFELCELLWQSGFMEEALIACKWSYLLHPKYEPTDFREFEKWVSSYVDNWATCDTLCNHTIGSFLEMYPKYLSKLKKWSKSKNRWMRRAAAVSLIVPARKGKFLAEVLTVGKNLLLDQDDLVQKGYGWMLKEASKMHQQEIFDFVMSNKQVMPRTALRYTIEKMPKHLKDKAMAK